MFKACSIMCVYNEEDIILESVSKLIESGIDVFIINNGCTDSTIDKIQHLVGKGIIDIKTISFQEDGADVFKLSEILKEVETISKSIDYDWFLHVDADEIRHSPWPELSLLEAIEKVNYEGYNLINFKLFNFRITEEFEFKNDYESSMMMYSSLENHSRIQIKSWKKTNTLNLTSYGGHIIQRDDPALYPLKFIHKHYPIRSIEHGIKKLKHERLARFSPEEKSIGWHTHYSIVDFDSLNGILWKNEELSKFEIDKELLLIYREMQEQVIDIYRLITEIEINDIYKIIESQFSTRTNIQVDHAKSLTDVAKKVISMSKNYPQSIKANSLDMQYLKYFFNIISKVENTRGNPIQSNMIENIGVISD